MDRMVEFPKNSPAWFEMENNAVVKDLCRQLNDGLLHPLEYAYAVVRIGNRYGLPEQLHCELQARAG